MRATGELSAIGTTVRVAATDPAQIDAAMRLVATQLERLDAAISRFRADSEVNLLAHVLTTAERGWPVSALVREHLRAADRAHRLSEGIVDPTIGGALVRAGYDTDLDRVHEREGSAPPAPRAPLPPDVPGWGSVRLHPDGTVSLPRGTLLDLGASGKAHAADTIAAELVRFLPGGFLVDLGGDVASSGPRPLHGWQLGVEDPDGHVAEVVRMESQAFATSSTRARTWRAEGEERHHIIDPRTGRVAASPWAQVTCAARSALDANAASTTAVVLGEAAPTWLARHGVPARLVRHDGTVVTTRGWSAGGRRQRAGVRSA
ncbi:hypothetical protein ASJ30_09210 [Janibacter indicus]|uniref:FAD:protein FMN transferase n=1 Tax=Janibacter indicus TaxID=857417 RepID=A0A1L3MHH6_9MICO|nr:FAD:protein FMN transferase [Janibacter indicus]APH01684.1 hypothetical protein ASJ30_09210 [Janibacter indicus]